MNEMQCNEDKIVYIQGEIQDPPQTKPYGWQTPSSPQKEEKRVASRGLVRISANCLSIISMYFIYISPFSTWSLKKWCLTFMCFTLP
jgi:hypothetical protein